MASCPVIPDVVHLMVNMGSCALVGFTVLAHLWLVVIARAGDQWLAELIV